MKPGLYVVGTPIGNLGDVSARAVDTLRQAALILAEDTRVTRRLLERYGGSASLMSCHKFSEASRAAAVAQRALAEVVALVTDSGMPCVSDPGSRIVRACRAAGARVVVVPGPSAVTAALALSGYNADRFSFGGFLPSHGRQRERRLADLLAREETIVLFESPHRIRRLMDEIAQAAPDRRVCLTREITKLFEETVEGSAADVRRRIWERPPRGEYTVVIAAASARAADGPPPGGGNTPPPAAAPAPTPPD